jgi:hypothetical protein
MKSASAATGAIAIAVKMTLDTATLPRLMGARSARSVPLHP